MGIKDRKSKEKESRHQAILDAAEKRKKVAKQFTQTRAIFFQQLKTLSIIFFSAIFIR